ncbi:MAG TPA: diadenylate cyclase CdaA [Candidatus Acidoferrales bacterium]|nr:diadenylate cyclase CdaA [Candidatus Acidoferrales bacterium]
MSDLWAQLRWQDAVDIGIIAFIVNRLIYLIKGTRAVQMIAGLAVILLVYLAAQRLGLFTLHWLLENLLGYMILIIIVIFQSDIRRALAQVGASPLFGVVAEHKEDQQVIQEVAKAAASLAQRKIGALIVLEREVGLNEYLEVGTRLDARVSQELLESVFLPHSPIHDGALVIQKGRVTAVRCLLPLSVDPNVTRNFGTRHRAAIGITEETDAVAVVVSEEHGKMSLVVRGRVSEVPDEAQLRVGLERLFAA